VKLKRITKILERLIFRRPLAGYIDLDALSDEPFIFLPDASGEFLFHIVLTVPFSRALIVSLLEILVNE